MEKITSEKNSSRFSAVFSNVGFLLLWLGQLTSQLADRVFVYVLMIIIYQLTHSNIGVSLPLLAFGIYHPSNVSSAKTPVGQGFIPCRQNRL